ncbi:hypothetical protein C8F01DRAFT_1246322 [Mycena amicta]|nr:hypothetical protein C8F01DRAFT_1246322 [Mycena amicta]
MTHPDDTDEDKKFLTTEMVDEIHTRLEARRVDQEQKKLEKKLKKGKKGAKRNPSVISRAPKSNQQARNYSFDPRPQPLGVADTNDASRPRSPNSKANKKCKKEPDHDEEVLDVPNKKRKKEPDEEVLEVPTVHKRVRFSSEPIYIPETQDWEDCESPEATPVPQPFLQITDPQIGTIVEEQDLLAFLQSIAPVEEQELLAFLQSIAPTIDLSTRIETFRRNDIWGLDDLEPLYERDYNDLVETLDVIFRKPFMDHGQMHPRVSSDGMKKVEIHALAAGIKRLEQQGSSRYGAASQPVADPQTFEEQELLTFLQSIAPTIDLSTRIETFRRNDIWGLDDLEPLYERDYDDLVETLDVIFRKPFMEGQMHPRVSSDGMKKVEIHALAAGIKRLERQGV